MIFINKLKIRYIVLFLFMLIYSFPVKCINLSSPISIGEPEKDKYLGIVFGMGQNVQKGTKLVNCDSCFFTNGLKFGYDFGIIYEQSFVNDITSFWHNFKWGAKAVYSDQGLNSNFVETVNAYYADYDMDIPIGLEHTNNIAISSIDIVPFLKYNFVSFAFVRFGIGANIIVKDFMEHKIKLTEKTKTLPNGEVVSIYIPGQGKKKSISEYVAEEGEIKGLNKFYLSYSPGLGFDFNLSDNLQLTTGLDFTLPLTNILSSYNIDFGINRWRISLELKYNVRDNSRVYR